MTFQSTVDRSKLETLATCAFEREADNVLFMGPPGVGKSHLAVALGVKAIKNGFSTTHFLFDDLMHVLKGDAAVPPRRLKARRYLNRRCSSSTKWASGPSIARRPTSSSAW